MRKATIHIIAGCLLLTGAAAAQAPLQFEVASVRPATDPANPNQVSVGVGISGSQVRVSYMSLKDYLVTAYGVLPQQIEGPDWLGSARFDIAAKIPDGARPSDVPAMLQALLVERFQMKMHREQREFPVYGLGVARDGLKLQPVEAPPQDPNAPATVTATGSGGGVTVDLGNGAFFSMANNRIDAKKVTMDGVARMLTRFMDRPVVDETSLTARYDLALPIAPEDYTALLIRAAVNGGVSLPPQALRFLDGASSDPLSEPLRQAGLTLTSKRAPLEVIVIESMSRLPTEN